ncbi:hypothetical protein ADN00_02280 [Ornatilinea apprima]|uniref:Uncharacterized protein n=1 Tax=Ornatilinea apprima TaxID=1134406 RepID=A0A0P6XHR9_9CHLR|nr:hypothetical protein [Ornatilinea apprima]KPL79647.1 hypothetical protein ADN00_02280 [Ornatilinea apprima]
MKKNMFLALAFLLIVCVLISSLLRENQKDERMKLAQTLGVRLEDHPPETDFPVSYFSAQLIEGMTLDEVHNLIIGFDQVYNCSNSVEVYYYFGANENMAFRFRVFYDENLSFKRLESEDPDSSYLSIEECKTGLLLK